MEDAQRVIDAHREDPFMFYNRAVIMDFARDGRKPSDQLYYSGFLGGVDQMKNTLDSCRPRFVKIREYSSFFFFSTTLAYLTRQGSSASKL